MFSIARFAAAALTTAAIVLSAVQPASAAGLSSALNGAGPLGENCLSESARQGQIGANLKLYQYYQYYQFRLFENGTKVHGFGTKIGPYGYRYYTFVIDLCDGEFIAEDELKNGKPGFAPE
jgi:hypothetical protein